MIPNRAGLEHASKRFIDNLVLGGLERYAGPGLPTLVAAETTAHRVAGPERDPEYALAGGQRLFPLRGVKRLLRRRLPIRGARPRFSDVLEYSVRADGEVHFTVLTAEEGAVRVVFDGTDGALIMCTPVTGDEGPRVSGGDNLLPWLPDALEDDAMALPTHDSVRERTRGHGGHRPTPTRRTTTAGATPRGTRGHRRRASVDRRPPTPRRPQTAVDRFRAQQRGAGGESGARARKRTRPAARASIQRPAAPARPEPCAPRGTDACAICLDRAVATVCIPCGHLATCVTCARNPQLRGCPICRTRLTSLVRTHTAGRPRAHLDEEEYEEYEEGEECDE